MKRLIIGILVISPVFLMINCSQGSRELADTNKKIQELRTEVDELKRQAEWEKLIDGFEGVAYLTPGANGYTVVKTDMGTLAVSLDDVKPYANGSKVTLRFGNVTSATLAGLKAKIEWGGVDKKGRPLNEEAKSRDVQFKESLLPGAWTNTNIVLEGASPSELGFIRIRDIQNNEIRLIRAN